MRIERKTIQDSLLLRKWALEILASSPAERSSEGFSTISSCSADSWRLFLRSERCAVPLSRAVDPQSLGPAAELLLRFTNREALRIRSGRDQCEEFLSSITTAGAQTILLKGAAYNLAASGSVDLSDIDLLCHPDHAIELQHALIRLGYVESGTGTSYCLPTLSRPSGLPIEIHTSIPWLLPFTDVWERAIPPGEGTGFWNLSGCDGLWHLLVHTVKHHPERRGRIRDLCMIAGVIAASTESDVCELTERIVADPCASPLLQLLGMAQDIARGNRPEDPFIGNAARSYIFRTRFSRRRMPPRLYAVVKFAHTTHYSENVLLETRAQAGFDRPSSVKLIRIFDWLFPTIPLRLTVRRTIFHAYRLIGFLLPRLLQLRGLMLTIRRRCRLGKPLRLM